MGDFTISDELKAAFEKQNIEYIPIKEATPEEFHKALGEAKKVNEHGAFVTQHSVDEYQDMEHLFLTLDGKAGIAIAKDNDIVSFFNGGERRGVFRTLLPVAIENGGRKLDNYNAPKLSALYELYGFNPFTSTSFNSKFAPADWNYERDGMPKVVFWIHNGDVAKDVVLNFGRYDVPWDAVQEFATYEEARERRDQIIEEIDAMEEMPQI